MSPLVPAGSGSPHRTVTHGQEGQGTAAAPALHRARTRLGVGGLLPGDLRSAIFTLGEEVVSVCVFVRVCACARVLVDHN